jgi:hypothetical protein
MSFEEIAMEQEDKKAFKARNPRLHAFEKRIID